MICSNLSVENGQLFLNGQNTVRLAREYGTPLYLLDEDRIRANCRMYKNAMQAAFGPSALPLYASKACSFKQIYRIMTEEGLGTDVVSPGEIYTASEAGFDMSQAYFHGNNKTDADIAFAMDRGIGTFVVDNEEEIRAIERIAGERGIIQPILLRITPGIDPHTYAAISTGKVDSKFGTALETGQAEMITVFTLKQKHIRLDGFHCHVGSQVFGEDVYERASDLMLGFMADMEKKYGYCARIFDIGGGYGVRYVEKDPALDIPERIRALAVHMRSTCEQLRISMPAFRMEPGRSIIADAGMTLYTVGTVKRIPGYKNYVSVDGGMTDNPRYALYGSEYTCCIANKMNESPAMECTLAGRCCESGDVIQEHVMFPQSVTRGDIAAVCTTGAYNYAMASNYNRINRPPVVMLSGNTSYIAVERESLADLCRNDR